MAKNEKSMRLYVDHEQHDAYIRDACVFRPEIDIYDKMSAQIKYANEVVVNYSLTTYSPYEGWKIAFNGMDGRIEAWLDIPYFENAQLSQAALHAAEMNQGGEKAMETKPLILHTNWNDFEPINVTYERKGHGGGDQRLQDKIFKDSANPDPLNHSAGIRDGAMSILIGIAARTQSGHLSLIEIEQETIVWPRNFAISPDGKYLLCANLKDDSISVFSINPETGMIDFTGHTITIPKPLCIKFLN